MFGRLSVQRSTWFRRFGSRYWLPASSRLLPTQPSSHHLDIPGNNRCDIFVNRLIWRLASSYCGRFNIPITQLSPSFQAYMKICDPFLEWSHIPNEWSTLVGGEVVSGQDVPQFQIFRRNRAIWWFGGCTSWLAKLHLEERGDADVLSGSKIGKARSFSLTFLAL